MKTFLQIFISFTLLFLFFLVPQKADAQFSGNLGAISGSIAFNSEFLTTGDGFITEFVGSSTNFTTSRRFSGQSYNTGFVLPEDTYTVKLYISPNSGSNYLIETINNVVVTAGNTSSANFDLTLTTGLAKGTLNVNGVNSDGRVQFCDPNPATPCPTPYNGTYGPMFSFSSGGFNVPLLPGNYRAHMMTTTNLDMGIVPITIALGQINNDPSLQFSYSLGAVSGSATWNSENLTAGDGLKAEITGNTNGNSTTINVNGETFNSGFSLLPDAYTIKLYVYPNSGNRYLVGTQVVNVMGGQTTMVNFDLKNTTGLVKGNLNISGVSGSGRIQFCNPSAPCTIPYDGANGPLFTFSNTGFRVPVIPGNYWVHVFTMDNIDAGIVPITVAQGQVIDGPPMQFNAGLGSVNMGVFWDQVSPSIGDGYRAEFTGLNTGFTSTKLFASNTSNTGAIFPQDTYNVKLYIRPNSGNTYLVASQNISVIAGQTATADFNLSGTTGIIRGDLKINGVNTGGRVQFCAPSPAPCTIPYDGANGPLFTFDASGFWIPLLPGNYCVHVFTMDNIDIGTTCTPLNGGELIDLPFVDNQPPTSPGVPVLSFSSETPNRGIFTLGWEASTDINNDPIKYELQHKDSNDAGFTTVDANITGNSYSFSISTAEAEGTWKYRVRASDGSLISAYSAESAEVKVDNSDPNMPTLSADREPDFAGTVEWYKETVTVSFSGNGDPTLQDSSLGSGVETVTDPVTKNTSGEQEVSGTATDFAGNVSNPATITVNVDSTPPQAELVCPTGSVILGNPASADWTATDAHSGLFGPASGSINLETSSVGNKTAILPAGTTTDNVGYANVQDSCDYTVIYQFSGFFQPVDISPTLNTVHGTGRNIKVKFSLNGDQGLSIFAGGYPISQDIDCDTGAPKDEIEETVTPGPSGLQYDAVAGQYAYSWSTNPAWVGTCRQLNVKLIDGTEHKANFEFN